MLKRLLEATNFRFHMPNPKYVPTSAEHCITRSQKKWRQLCNMYYICLYYMYYMYYMYSICMYYICIIRMYFQCMYYVYASHYLGALWGQKKMNNVSCESKGACKYSAEVLQLVSWHWHQNLEVKCCRSYWQIDLGTFCVELRSIYCSKIILTPAS